MRIAFAALVLVRPAFRGHDRAGYLIVASLLGLVVLGERLEMRAVAAVLFVTAAAAASLFGRQGR